VKYDVDLTTVIEWLVAVLADHWWMLMGAGGAGLLVVLLVVRVVRARRRRAQRPDGAAGETSAGSGGFYTAAFMSLGLSVDTSWRFFEHKIGIENTVERVGMFAILEVLLISCGWALRAQVRSKNGGGPKGPYQAVAWVLTGAAAFMAVMVTDDFLIGLARVVLGPVVGLVALHLALGLDLRHRNPSASTGIAARIANELLQRALSHLGLADDDRDAARRRSDRHARQLAWMVVDGVPKDAKARKKIDRALRLSNVAHDPEARDRLLAELAVIRHVDELANLDQPSPWGVEVRTSDPAAEADPGPRTPDLAEVRTPDPRTSDLDRPRTPDPAGPRTPDPVDEIRTPDPAAEADLGPRTRDLAEVRTADPGPSTEQFPALVGGEIPESDDEVFAALVVAGLKVYRDMIDAGERVNQRSFRNAVRASGASLKNDHVRPLWAAVRQHAALAAV
jgi:hypothetical protein